MSSAEGMLPSPIAPAPATAVEPASAPPARRRLFRKYALLFIGLVGAALLITSGFDFWFSYQETKSALIRLQQEKALAAAERIGSFIEEIEQQIGWTTHAQWAAAPLDQRRQDYFRLLRQVPAITEVRQLDRDGRERLKVSRLAMDVIDSGTDLSESPAFTGAKADRLWFSPVYFRKQSEPYVTMAVAHQGRNAGVTVAEINLKLIWDVITGLKIGRGGYAYVVDAKGRLIAHPDISLVLRGTDLSGLPQVAAALAQTPEPGGRGAAAVVAENLAGKKVLSAHAPIAPLGWLVFVEAPLSEAFAPLYGAALRTGLLLIVGLAAATLLALFLARRMTGPIRAIAAGAERFGAGEFGRRIELHTGDELEALAGQFNRMAADLQKSYAELEQRVRDRTAELSEALEQQTATAELLGIINSSPGDLAPVLDAMLDKATQLCEAAFGILWSYDGANLHVAAMRGAPPEYTRFLRATAFHPASGNVQGRLLAGEPFVHVVDVADTDEYREGKPLPRAMVDIGGGRSLIAVALRKEGVFLGDMVIYRREVRPFTPKQIALLQNFAAQAVIAMENARLINETREALEQQTATAEVLQVINSSPGDLAPVFDAILEKAHSLCGAELGRLFTYDGETFRPVAAHGPSQRLPMPTEWMREGFRPAPGNPFVSVIEGAQLVHIADIRQVAAQFPNDAGLRTAVENGLRTFLIMPLRKDDTLLGVITAIRREVRPFTDKQIALLQNFAAQAVIAMENARLINETREALEQQTATAEVLQVINSSPGDLAPVFDAMLERATQLCGGAFGILWVFDGEYARAGALHEVPEAYAKLVRAPFRPSPESGPARVMRGEGTVVVPDVMMLPGYAGGDFLVRAIVDLAGARSVLIVPMRKDGITLGAITTYRKEVRPFTDKQIALLENFAAQAVIAMENARLITETREALEQQTATAEVLQVINASPGDLAPVFDAMLEKAMRLCDAGFGILWRLDDGKIHPAAHHNLPSAYADFLAAEMPQPGPAVPIVRALQKRSLIHLPELSQGEAYSARDPFTVAGVELGGIRTLVAVPLIKDDTGLGAFALYRQEVRPFTDKQIALLQNFAAQAVIAMENARLINETREALEQQTATAEVLQVINSSPGDLKPVFDAMLEKAARLCEAPYGILRTWDGECFHLAAVHGDARFEEWCQRRAPFVPENAGGPLARLVNGEQVIPLRDALVDPAYERSAGFREMVDASGLRSGIAVALRKDDKLLGTLTIYRQEVRPFSDKQIALLQNFAAQAVIAMENARLITETREALEQQTATAEVLQVINSSPGDLAPVFGAILEKAHNLCGAIFGTLQLYDGEKFCTVTMRGIPEPQGRVIREPYAPDLNSPYSPLRTLVEGGRFVQFPDLAARNTRATNPRSQVAVDLGVRTMLFLPLRKDDHLLGLISVARKEVKPFSEREITLLESFAAQAVIAIENARLLTELRDRTRDLQESLEYQTATSDVLKVISQSTFDLQPVLETVADTAARLCNSEIATILRRQGEVYRVVAAKGWSPEYRAFLERHTFVPDDRGTLTGRVVQERRTVQVADVTADPEYTLTESMTLGKARTQLGVPLLREGSPIGVIIVSRQRVEPFTEKQIELVTTFADQAVIAIENARLLGELRERTDELARSVEELKALSEVGQAVSATLDIGAVLSTILDRSVGLTQSDAGAIFRYRRRTRSFRLFEAVGWDAALTEQIRKLDIAEDATGMGEATAHRTSLQFPDLERRAGNPLRDMALAAGYRSVLIVPLAGPDRVFGAIVLQRRAPGEFPEASVRLMQTIASQSALAIENARLFREIAEKSEQLAEASRHKSQFLANMSHELRTPLNAILGYAELMADGIYGALPPRASGVLERMQNNGKHLLALINDVLDLSKIEAGQLVFALEDYSLADVVRSAVSATEGMARGKGLELTADIAPGLPTGRADARRLQQVLLNLVGNAVKFTDAGLVAIRALAEGGNFVVTVRDTGPGIGPEDHARIFEEFQQVDSSNTRNKGGTGLGLAISRRIIEMQGGAISVESELGKGATFRVVLPIRVENIVEEAAGDASEPGASGPSAALRGAA